jgi:hypothetical protein
MNDFDILPEEIKNQSLSKEEVILDFDHSMKALDFFMSMGYASLGFELLKLKEEQLKEVKNYVSYLPDQVIWDAYVLASYEEVKGNMIKEFNQLRYSEEGEDDYFFCLTFLNKEEFEEFYYEYITID